MKKQEFIFSLKDAFLAKMIGRSIPQIDLRHLSTHFPILSLFSIKGRHKGLVQFLLTKNTFKMIKNYFYFTLKVLFLPMIFKFLFLLFGRINKRFDQKDRLISKFMMLQSGTQIIAIHILPNITRSKDNETLKFGQLTEDNMRNIFLEKSYTKRSGEIIPRPYSKK